MAGRICIQGGRRAGARLPATSIIPSQAAGRWSALQGGAVPATTTASTTVTTPPAQGHGPDLAPAGGLAVQARELGGGGVHGARDRQIGFSMPQAKSGASVAHW